MSDTVGDTALAASDIVVIVIYFAFILFVGLWTSQSNRGSVGGYFLAGRNMNWVPLGASLFASNVGSLHFVGLAGSGAEAGIGIAIYELNAIFILIMLGWLFVPVYIASGVFTMPEYIKKRFGGDRIRMYLAVLSLILYIFTKISADLYAGALFIGQALGWNIYTSIVLLLLIASIFTITGGLTAVMWTDFIQTIIMVVGAIGLMALGFVEVGGMNGLRYKYERAVPNTTFLGNDTCGYPRDDYFSLIRDAQSGDIPWPGIIGITINSIWYWCADQVIVQRTLAGKTYSHAKGGTILAGYLKTLPLFMLVIPGMMARVLYTDEIACVDPDVCTEVCGSPAGCSDIAYPLLVLNLLPAGEIACVDPDVCTEVCGSPAGCSDIAYPLLVLNILPTGWRGVMLAVMLSALMSSLTSIFNSSSTIFTLDIWIKIRKHASDIELMIVGRLCVLVLMVVSILWIHIIQQSQGGQLFVYIQQVSSFLQPPICAILCVLVLMLVRILWTHIIQQSQGRQLFVYIQQVSSFRQPPICAVLCVLVLMVVSILWIPIIQQSQGGQLFVYIQQVSSFLQPPICAVYLLAVFWTRANEQGAFWSLMVGLLIGGTRFILEFSFPPPFCYEGVPDDRPAMIKNFHYLYFAIFLFGVTGIVAIVVSLLTPAIDPIHLPRLTYQSRYSTEPRVDIDQEEEEEEEEGKEGEDKGNKLTVEEYSALPFYRRGLYWVCGIDQQMQQQPISEIGAQYNTKEEKEEEDFKNQGPSIDISEEPFWQRFLFVQAMILMTVATLVCGFFAYSTFIVPIEYPTQ